ncbi:cell envelope biogenesis protein OmpA [Seonamhaeicola sp. S2-3]|uniref:outer membrane beta-barrel protein n=1 Tax=Seonamhaeicola sp. S2-3 TaxID=1936081 RepID=UPI000972A360|nr:outer membrane beta-barrel protein [Seonamhaeicola sp. S2-3]APY10577.1 cell envelope biogenesis protein OmpA [Seonamhaeicola sp. S2-3]
MNFNFKIYKTVFCLLCSLGLSLNTFAQYGKSAIKAQAGLGVSSPSQSGFVEDFEGNNINFPAVNLGVQYMFQPKLGAKLDYNFSRISNADDSPEFKLNYSRVNLQAVYNASSVFSFFPPRIGVFVHAGPGYSFVKPLGNYTQNNTSYFNVMGGVEFHYGISDKLSIFTDVSYVNGFSKDFNPVTNGYGSFNGNILTITFGASISLSGCYYCD